MALRRSLGKDADGPVSRFVNRPLSTRLSMALAPLRPAPDLVSLVALVLGLAGGALLAAGQGLAGALLVHASSVADGVDGEVARLQLRGGPRGALLDGVLDRVGDAAIVARQSDGNRGSLPRSAPEHAHPTGAGEEELALGTARAPAGGRAGRWKGPHARPRSIGSWRTLLTSEESWMPSSWAIGRPVARCG
jgi:CDP-alcohol phosphatidyltransferase